MTMLGTLGVLGAVLATVCSAMEPEYSYTWKGPNILWDGRFNDVESNDDLLEWSPNNRVGPYQYYIHGQEEIDAYVNLDSKYKNPADHGCTQGAKITIDPTSTWSSSSNSWRTELIPEPDSSLSLNGGRVYYHFSMMMKEKNAPNADYEHRMAFFESEFTGLKFGWTEGDPEDEPNYDIQWMAGGQRQWAATWEPGVWHNFAYDVDFTIGAVSLYHSTDGDSLQLTFGPVSVDAESSGSDWHLGVLRLPRKGYSDTDAEDWYFSGIYIEDGDLTTSVTRRG